MKTIYKPNYVVVNSIFPIFMLLFLIASYVNGVYSGFMVVQFIIWFVSYITGIVLLKNLEILSLFYNTKYWGYLFILNIVGPSLYSLAEIIDRRDRYSELSEKLIGFFALSVLTYILVFSGLCVIYFSIRFRREFTKLYHPRATIEDRPVDENERILVDPEDILGRGNSSIDKVISSILSRASASIKMSKFSLVIMVILVFIGGGASIGTIAIDQFSKAREVEKHRLALLKVLSTLEPTLYEKPGDEFSATTDSAVILDWKVYVRESFVQDSLKLVEIKEAIVTTYGQKETYKDLLITLTQQSNFSITEIIMRISIAALTLFLVQVFFHIYRFNQQQSTSLFTKAEVLELYKDSGSDMKFLRATLATKIEENPKFGKTPSTPIEQIINIADKGKGALH